jgi:hypothetical protein
MTLVSPLKPDYSATRMLPGLGPPREHHRSVTPKRNYLSSQTSWCWRRGGGDQTEELTTVLVVPLCCGRGLEEGWSIMHVMRLPRGAQDAQKPHGTRSLPHPSLSVSVSL